MIVNGGQWAIYIRHPQGDKTVYIETNLSTGELVESLLATTEIVIDNIDVNDEHLFVRRKSNK